MILRLILSTEEIRYKEDRLRGVDIVHQHQPPTEDVVGHEDVTLHDHDREHVRDEDDELVHK